MRSVTLTHTLRAQVPAALGATGFGSRSGTVGCRSAAAGYGLFEYWVCDRHRQCTAEVVVAVETP